MDTSVWLSPIEYPLLCAPFVQAVAPARPKNSVASMAAQGMVVMFDVVALSARSWFK